ncbi:MAG: DUF4832 domain-containing protein [Bacteroidales bacterium]|nr:DUF4832 domain-containing protein [Bacteroidales bacterium]
MKRLLVYAAAALLLLANACGEEPAAIAPPKTKGKTAPELKINGAPVSIVESGTSFEISISTDSEGEVSFSADKPSLANVSKNAALEYRITVASVKDATVTLVAYQKAEGKFSEAEQKVSFRIKGSGEGILPGPDDEVAGNAVNYTELAGAAYGPERGMYLGYEINGEGDIPKADDVHSRCMQGYRVQLLEFCLGPFISGSISQAYLQYVQRSFDAVREGGAKAIVRFAYVFRYDENKDQNVVTDGTVEQVLRHVQQLKPYLRRNEDVIFVLQAGFVGAWGEWYYTSHFGMNPNSEASYKPRKQLTDALLEALPPSRQVELRTPKFKMGMYNLSLADTLTAERAHDGSIYSRLAGHNDCFVADAEDKGTFDNNISRKFWKAESRYTIMGGETCAVSDYSVCGQTLKDLEDYHWTYLNDGYHEGVISGWKSGGCYGEIVKRLGYRLVLKDVHYGAVASGQPCKVTIRFYNKGFAAPMNPREAWLVWKGSDGSSVKTALGVDPREWYSGYNAVVATFTPSSDKGTLYLELSDPLLPTRPEYSLPLANEGVFNSETGMNKLFEIK